MTTAERIADFAFKASFDKDVSELEKLLQAQDATTRMENDTLLISKANYSTGLISDATLLLHLQSLPWRSGHQGEYYCLKLKKHLKLSISNGAKELN